MKTISQLNKLQASLSGRELTPDDFKAITEALIAVRKETKHSMFAYGSDSLAHEVVQRANYWLSVKAQCPDSRTAKTPMLDFIREILVKDSFFGWPGYLSQIESILASCSFKYGAYYLPEA